MNQSSINGRSGSEASCRDTEKVKTAPTPRHLSLLHNGSDVPDDLFRRPRNFGVLASNEVKTLFQPGQDRLNAVLVTRRFHAQVPFERGLACHGRVSTNSVSRVPIGSDTAPSRPRSFRSYRALVAAARAAASLHSTESRGTKIGWPCASTV